MGEQANTEQASSKFGEYSRQVRLKIALCHCLRVNQGCFLHGRLIDCLSRFAHGAWNRKTTELVAEQKQQSEEQQKDESGKRNRAVHAWRFDSKIASNPAGGRNYLRYPALSDEIAVPGPHPTDDGCGQMSVRRITPIRLCLPSTTPRCGDFLKSAINFYGCRPILNFLE